MWWNTGGKEGTPKLPDPDDYHINLLLELAGKYKSLAYKFASTPQDMSELLELDGQNCFLCNAKLTNPGQGKDGNLCSVCALVEEQNTK